jgi:carbonic anhydrase/acetyltransferase-like protein (isoleucine patch superfamily)
MQGDTAMAIFRLGDLIPAIDPDAWVAESAVLIGRVELAAASSVWFNATLRGDNDRISIGARSNIQDGSVIHTDAGVPVVIAEGVTVGHQVMLHGCTIGEGSLIGIQAVVLNGARIGRECLIGAGALITEGKEIPDRSMVMGSPGKVVRMLTDDEVERIRRGNQHYVEESRRYRHALQQI